MPAHRLPVRPDLDQLHRQAKELLREMHARGESAKLADAQLALARAYGASNWTRFVHAVQLSDAIWRDDLDTVRTLVTRNPKLIHEHVLIREDSNWGPPMSYAASAGRERIVRFLFGQGAKDREHAAGRAALAGHSEIVFAIYDLMGRPPMERLTLAGPAYTLSVEGTAALLALGARIVRADGSIDHNAVEHLLGSDSRNPPAKHRILEMWIEHGFNPPDTPVTALHRGRIDLLEQHLERDAQLLTRTFDIKDVYPLAPACFDNPYRAQGTPIHNVTLLHLAAYFDELDIAQWLLDRGMNPDVPAAIDADGFGGYTALFSTVVSQHNFWVNYGKGSPDDAVFTKLLLDRGANPNHRASIRHGLEDGHGGGPVREYRDVTPIGWAEQFPAKVFVSRESMRLIEAAGGGR